MPDRTISIDRAPVLTLWAAVVAARLGFDENEARRFRPAIPSGLKGWGTKGELDLGLIEGLAKEA
jgi:hypothetical protein